MTVVDASVFIDALVVVGPPGDAARSALRGSRTLHVPAIFSAEVASGVRGMCARGELAEHRALAALAALRTVAAVTYPFEPFLDRVWELRRNVTVYDGWYVALAESLGCELITADSRLARAGGTRCRIVDVCTASPEPRKGDPA